VYSFSPYDSGSAFYYDAIDQWAQITTIMLERMGDMVRRLELRDERLAAQEAEFVAKMGVNWRMTGYGQLLKREPQIVSNKSQADALRPWLRRIATKLLHTLESTPTVDVYNWYLTGPVKVGKGKGAPYWFSGNDRESALFLARITMPAGSAEQTVNQLMDVGQARVPLCQTIYPRVQSSASLRPHRALIGSQIVEIGEEYGPKVREIAAQAFGINVLWAGVGNLLKTAMVTTFPQLDGQIGPAIALYEQQRYALAVDLKAYDTTVSIETLDVFREEILGPLLATLRRYGIISAGEEVRLMTLDALTQELPVLTPPGCMNDGASLVPRRGGIQSGERLTSVKGTLINMARIMAKAAALDIRVQAANFGDDMLITSQDARLRRLWLDHDEWRGFREVGAPDLNYLMRRIPEGYVYVARMLLSTINREPQHEPRSAIQAALGIRVRDELLTGHPAKPDYLATLSDLVAADVLPTRAQIAVRAALALPIETLLDAVALDLRHNPPQQTGVTDSIGQTVSSYLSTETSISGRAAALRLRSALEDVVRRWEVPFGEFRRMVMDVPHDVAVKAIRRRSYTLR
jgi:hypothetical protein